MLKRILFVLLMGIVLSVALTACGGDAPVPTAFSRIPVFSGSKEATNAEMIAMAARIYDVTKEDAKDAKNIEYKAYVPPANWEWNAFKSFYRTALEKDGWTAVIEYDGIGILIWEHRNRKQTIGIQLFPGFYIVTLVER